MNLPKLYPLRFNPYLKKVGWGGNKIASLKGLLTKELIGESWEVSGLEGYETRVSEGELTGKTLSELISLYGKDLVGNTVFEIYGDRFPLLVKFIDARENLSVQVHPDEETATVLSGGHGKHELCYIMEANDDAKIYSGLNKTITPKELFDAATEGTIMEHLVEHDSESGNVYPIPAGRIHAFGGGNLIAEVQLSSDITFRIYDYNRPDTSGNLRTLHHKEAEKAIDFNVYDDYSTYYDRSEQEVKIADHEWFVVTLVNIRDKSVSLPSHPGSFIILMGIEGTHEIVYPEGKTELKKGESLLIPASLNDIKISGKGKILTAHIPNKLP